MRHPSTGGDDLAVAGLNLLATAVNALRPLEAFKVEDIIVVDLLFAREPRLLTPDKSRMFDILDQLQVMHKHRATTPHHILQPLLLKGMAVAHWASCVE